MKRNRRNPREGRTVPTHVAPRPVFITDDNNEAPKQKRCNVDQEQDSITKFNYPNIPSDVLTIILSFLPLHEIHMRLSVSKNWYTCCIESIEERHNSITYSKLAPHQWTVSCVTRPTRGAHKENQTLLTISIQDAVNVCGSVLPKHEAQQSFIKTLKKRKMKMSLDDPRYQLFISTLSIAIRVLYSEEISKDDAQYKWSASTPNGSVWKFSVQFTSKEIPRPFMKPHR
jgi:hypothetical protein